jgi:hypothetical protein
MKTIVINRFDGGMAESQHSRGEGMFSEAKNFDTLTFPYRMRPYRGVETDSSVQRKVGNLLIGSQGEIFGLGNNDADTANKIFYKPSSITGAWEALGNSTTGGTTAGYDLLVEYRIYSSGVKRRLFIGRYRAADTSTGIQIVDPAGVAGIDYHALSWTTRVGQGVVHPKDDILYIPYDNKIATFDSPISGSGDVWNDTALTLPSTETITSISPYGNYLAIATVPTISIAGLGSVSGSFKSKVYIWDRDTSLNTLSEVIDWGTGVLRVLNELDGVLIGISDAQGTTTTARDFDSILIKAYNGVAPELIREIATRKETTTAPDAAINPRVNFIHRGKLYFSANIVGGSTSPSLYGLWSIGKSRLTGQYSITVEAGATNDNSETGILAAVIVGDLFQFVHTAEGTVTRSETDYNNADAFAQTAFYESVVNPSMSSVDYVQQKQLCSVSCHYMPLPAVGSTVTNFITFQYRVDGGDWTAIFTEATEGVTATERIKDASGDEFTAGRNYEFRIESKGGAEILGFTYKYEILETNV